MLKIASGVYKFTLGTPDEITYVSLREYPMREFGADCPCPIGEGDITFTASHRGCTITLPQKGEVFGLGLQLTTLSHTQRKRTMRCNADPQSTSGETHAPVPFFVTTAGYGVLVDCARDVAFYFGQAKAPEAHAWAENTDGEWTVGETAKAYSGRSETQKLETRIEIPVAQGADVYIFAGENMLDAVQKYNMFCGGGADMPEWGLGAWYRLHGQSVAQDWISMAERFKAEDMPITVLGLEPGWQTHAYSCSFKFNEERVGDHRGAIDKMHELGYRVNLWEHCYTHPTSPIYEDLLPYAGSHAVWGGLVPDFLQDEARAIFQNHHKTLGADCFKLDECDGSDLTGCWSFPDGASFPSGADGEQMHHILGLLYQQTMHEAFPGSCHSVRASGAMASPYPFILYSDLYAHRDFIRGVVNAGFSGLLWAPEVRHAENLSDYVRRMQTALFSPQLLMNAWYLKNPPWDQLDSDLNNADIRMEEADLARELTHEILHTRKNFVPYLKRMYDLYRDTGKPVFRALALDYPADESCLTIDDEYMMGDDYLFAPLTAESDTREVYLPEGNWERNGQTYASGKYTFTCALNEYLLFKKA